MKKLLALLLLLPLTILGEDIFLECMPIDDDALFKDGVQIHLNTEKEMVYRDNVWIDYSIIKNGLIFWSEITEFTDKSIISHYYYIDRFNSKLQINVSGEDIFAKVYEFGCKKIEPLF
jgi:hypothetical protein